MDHEGGAVGALTELCDLPSEVDENLRIDHRCGLLRFDLPETE